MTSIVKRSLLAASTVIAASAIAVAVADPAPSASARPSYQELARESADIAAWANEHHLVGLSPASLHALPCRGLSPASARDCPAEVFAGLDNG